jgi:phosphate transport system protein
MSRHLQQEFEQLKKDILSLGAQVEESVRLSVRSISQRDSKIAQRIIDGDLSIDQREVEIEENCLKVLALHQPVAIDLRFIVAVMKINNDLERIADLAVNVAERTVSLAKVPPISANIDFQDMATKVEGMLRVCLDALVQADPQRAREVLTADDEIDTIHRHMYEVVEAAILKNPAEINALIQMLAVSRYLERIADHTTNIAEDVIYLVEGEIIRHGINHL